MVQGLIWDFLRVVDHHINNVMNANSSYGNINANLSVVMSCVSFDSDLFALLFDIYSDLRSIIFAI